MSVRQHISRCIRAGKRWVCCYCTTGRKPQTEAGGEVGGGRFWRSWKGGNVFEDMFISLLTPGRQLTELLISLCARKGGGFSGRFPWCRAVLFGSLQGAVASFPLWVDPGSVSGTEVHQKPQQLDYEVSLFRSKPHSALTKTASRHPWCGFGLSGVAGNTSSALLCCRDFLSRVHYSVCFRETVI